MIHKSRGKAGICETLNNTLQYRNHLHWLQVIQSRMKLFRWNEIGFHFGSARISTQALDRVNKTLQRNPEKEQKNCKQKYLNNLSQSTSSLAE